MTPQQTPDNNFQANLLNIVALQQQLAERQGELTQLQAQKQQLDAIQQAWNQHTQRLAANHNQTDWLQQNRTGQTIAQLHQLKSMLADKVHLWVAALPQEQPESRLNEARAELTQAQTNLTNLKLLEALLNRAGALRQRAQAVTHKRHLLERLHEARQQLEALEISDPELMNAYDQLMRLKEKAEEQQQLRKAVIDSARQLAELLHSDQKIIEEWSNLAIEDKDKLSQEIGRSISYLQQAHQDLSQEADQLARQSENRHTGLEPQREQAANLEAAERQAAANFKDETNDLMQWAKEMTRLNRPNVDGKSVAELEQFLSQLQAEYQHLTWFEQIVTP